MFILACRDMGPDCDYKARGASKEEVMELITKHGTDVHPDVMKKMEKMSQDEVRDMMMSKIQETA